MLLQTLFKKMAKENPANSRLSVDSGPFVFHYIIGGGVCYLTLTDRCTSGLHLSVHSECMTCCLFVC